MQTRSMMRIVLQNRDSSLYYGQVPGSWTPNFKEAHNFGEMQKAAEYAQSNGWSDVQVLAILSEGARLEFVPIQIQAIRSQKLPAQLTLSTGT
jgi:hypothetical protein